MLILEWIGTKRHYDFLHLQKASTLALLGTTDIGHLKQNIEIFTKGKLPDEIYQRVRNAFIQNDHNWVGQV